MAKVEETANRLGSATSLSAANDDTNDDKQVESDYFKLMDMFWVPRLVSGRSKWVSILLVVSMPIMTLLAMLLGLASSAWLIKHRYDVPLGSKVRFGCVFIRFTQRLFGTLISLISPKNAEAEARDC